MEQLGSRMLHSPTLRVCLVPSRFPGEAPSSQAVSIHSVVVWLRVHPEPG
jgi:hypothetical protein